jgi:GTPase SAR1 family protein
LGNHLYSQSKIIIKTFRYIKGIFPSNIGPTVALEFCTKVLKVSDNSKIKVQIWDTAGQEKYKSIVSQ